MEQRSRGSWWEPDQSEQEAEELQRLIEELGALELQVAAMHPKELKEVQRLQNVEPLLKRKLKAQPIVGGSWR